MIITNIESPPNALADQVLHQTHHGCLSSENTTSGALWLLEGQGLVVTTIQHGGLFWFPFNHPVYSAGAGTVKQVFEDVALRLDQDTATEEQETGSQSTTVIIGLDIIFLR